MRCYREQKRMKKQNTDKLIRIKMLKKFLQNVLSGVVIGECGWPTLPGTVFSPALALSPGVHLSDQTVSLAPYSRQDCSRHQQYSTALATNSTSSALNQRWALTNTSSA